MAGTVLLVEDEPSVGELVRTYLTRDGYRVTGLPHMVIIGRDGKIVRVFEGYDESTLPQIADAINRATGAAQ